jgi:hypothetical protein
MIKGRLPGAAGLAVAAWLMAGSALAQDCIATDMGAVPDGKTVNTQALQTMFDQCASKGRRVVLAGGAFLTGNLTLRSNLHLHIEGGATLLGSADPNDYNGGKVVTDNEDGREQPLVPLLTGEKLDNFTLTGSGTIDGQGDKFWDENTYNREFKGKLKKRPMPWFIVNGCRNLTVRDITLTRSPSFGLTLEQCEGGVIDGLKVFNPFDSPNTDGIQMNDSASLRLSRCHISTGDDAIVIKARRRIVDSLIISDCHIESDDAGIKFGTNSRTGVRNSLFQNIVITRTRFGIALFMIDGGEHRDNRFHNIRIDSATEHRRNYPIYVDIDKRRPESTLGQINGLTFSDIDIRTKGSILIAGQKDAPIRDLTFRNVRMEVVNPTELTGPKPGGNRNRQKQAGTEDFSDVNASATFAHVHGLRIEGFSIQGASGGRAPIALQGVHDAQIGRMDARTQ